jgi:hypothetical protein
VSRRGFSVVGGDSLEVHPHELPGRDDSIVDRVLNGGNRCFDEIEGATDALVVRGDGGE